MEIRQNIFFIMIQVFFFSTHDQFAYPGTGYQDVEEMVRGLGLILMFTCLVKPRIKKLLKFNEKLIPNVQKFKPDFILTPGFDSRINDNLGCFDLSDNCFRQLTKILVKLSKLYCNNRILSILEGGYNLDGNAKATLTHIDELNNLN